MDPTRFDSLARAIAAPKSRRSLLGSVAALGAGLLGARAAGAQVTQAQCGNQVCAANPGVCANGCVCCVYGNGNSRRMPLAKRTGFGSVIPTTTTTTTAAPTTTTTTTTTAAPCNPAGTVGCTGENDAQFCCSHGCFDSGGVLTCL